MWLAIQGSYPLSSSSSTSRRSSVISSFSAKSVSPSANAVSLEDRPRFRALGAIDPPLPSSPPTSGTGAADVFRATTLGGVALGATALGAATVGVLAFGVTAVGMAILGAGGTQPGRYSVMRSGGMIRATAWPKRVIRTSRPSTIAALRWAPTRFEGAIASFPARPESPTMASRRERRPRGSQSSRRRAKARSLRRTSVGVVNLAPDGA